MIVSAAPAEDQMLMSEKEPIAIVCSHTIQYNRGGKKLIVQCMCYNRHSLTDLVKVATIVNFNDDGAYKNIHH